MNSSHQSSLKIQEVVDEILPDLMTIYKDFHANPELSMQEFETSRKLAAQLQMLGFDVTSQVGNTGVVGLLRNGDGPVAMLRADMDALPVKEENGVAYVSTKIGLDRTGKSVALMHACGHDLHVTCALGAARLLASDLSAWQGTLMVVFQPAEETSEGARAMIADGFLDRFPRPDIILGQHVINTPLGSINLPDGVATSAGDSLKIRLIGRGSHGAMPENAIDPVVMAAATVMRLQTIVSREVSAEDAAIVTVGSLQAGTMENIIPDEAVLKVNIRTFKKDTRERVIAAVKRIVAAEAAAAGAVVPPEITTINHFAIVQNDHEAAARLTAAFQKHFQNANVHQSRPTKMSDDFGEFSDASGVPAIYWFIGSTPPEIYARMQQENRLAELPANHNPRFLPALAPTLTIGVQTLAVAALEWLSHD